MPHFLSTDMQQGKRYGSCCFFYYAVFSTLLLVCLPGGAVGEESSNEKILITGLSAATDGKDLKISVHCDKESQAFSVPLIGPDRIAVTFVGGEIAPDVDLSLPATYNIEVRSAIIPNRTPTQLQITFSITQQYELESRWVETAYIITLKDFFKEEQQAEPDNKPELSDAPASSSAQDPASSQENAGQGGIDRHLPDMSDVLRSVSEGAEPDKKQAASGTEGVAPLGENEKISVDFYKIDLHNVFRMLREITGKNIIIAQGVSGSLTLALNDVPWRFVLDIILNLKDLSMMERDNTIVIYPKSKEFVWPEQEPVFDPYKGVETKEPEKPEGKTTIRPSPDTIDTPEQLEAKKLIANGRVAEKKGDLETAVRFYEQALDHWPENSNLANKIATTYLAQLNQNAKAVFFAKRALEADKKNSAAALNAAIGYANMEEYQQAQQYFDQSVNTGKPGREALISYAAFSERQKQYDAALRLLKKLEELYGQDLNSMVAQARIYDSVGDYRAARKKYKAILHAGFRVPPDLKKFILSKTSND